MQNCGLNFKKEKLIQSTAALYDNKGRYFPTEGLEVLQMAAQFIARATF